MLIREPLASGVLEEGSDITLQDLQHWRPPLSRYLTSRMVQEINELQLMQRIFNGAEDHCLESIRTQLALLRKDGWFHCVSY